MKQLLGLFLFTTIALSFTAQKEGYYRSPSINNSTIVFTAEGDLWKHDVINKQTIRLTTSHGMESDASISPDGKQIAFLGQYEGPAEVYVININGGAPKRLTFEESRARIHGWTEDGQILYSTNFYSTLPGAKLLKLNPTSLVTTLYPLAEADQGVVAANGNLYFTKLRKQGSHNKRYEGGTIQSIFMYDGKNEAIDLTVDNKRTNKNPMVFNNRIYFLSDRDDAMNIWSMDLEGKNLTQHTKSVKWDYKDPEMHNGKIVFQKGADIMTYDIKADKVEKVEIKITSDFDQMRKQWIKNPKSKISGMDISYDGKKIALISRGRIFTKPVEGERWTEVTRKYGVRYKKAAFTKQNTLVTTSDESGEFELWSINGSDFSAPSQLSKGSSNMMEHFATSPNGKLIIYTEKDNRLLLFNVATKKSTLVKVGSGRYGGSFSWSRDSRWVLFDDGADNGHSQVNILDTKTNKSDAITSVDFDSYGGQFSPDNNWIYFTSDRTFNNQVGGPWGPRQPEPYYENTAKIYALAVDSSVDFPFLPENELNKKQEEEKKDESKSKEEDKEEILPVKIDLEKITEQLYLVPMKSRNIGKVAIGETHLYWADYNRSTKETTLNAVALSGKADNKTIKVAEKISYFKSSGDGATIVIKNKKGLFKMSADGSKLSPEAKPINFKNWNFTIDPVEDWEQMFLDAWRMERDYFYDQNMHGVDWDKMYEQYHPLLSRVTDRHELDDLMAQMISELATLHMFVYGGDKRTPLDKTTIGFLGATFIKNVGKKGYVIEHIYKTDIQYPDQLSPLALPHLNINEGDVITHVNGVSVMEVSHINELLTNKIGLQSRVKFTSKEGKSFEEIIKPISARDHFMLRYAEWEYTRILKVNEQSDNRIGYVHLRAMGRDNYTEWVKGFYPNFKKEGLIIDVRHNRGGNIDSWILEKLLRKEWFFWAPRVGDPSWNMQYAFRGHVVVLMDEKTASDGEAFSEGFRALGLGKLIGKRTWGGEVWLSSSNRLVDNGIATAAEFGVFDANGNWLIEGIGVVPDIEVDNLPVATFKGGDAQLEKGIELLLQMMKDTPVKVPAVPEYPNKSVEYNKR